MGIVSRIVSARGAKRTLSAPDAYALWADNYPPWSHNALMTAEQAVVEPLIMSTSPERALDIGTGSGRYLPVLRSAGAQVVVGLDRSWPMLTSRAGGAANVVAGREAAISRVCADGCRLPFRDEGFDVISSSLMVGDVEDLAGWVREAARVLAPGGHIIYSDFHPSWVENGWRRTFTAADGRDYSVAYFPHTIAQHRDLLKAESLEVRALCEPDRLVVVVHAVKRPRG